MVSRLQGSYLVEGRVRLIRVREPDSGDLAPSKWTRLQDTRTYTLAVSS